jgi:methylmalonyl-CoA/ethylmalonyl-CoA epimerase
MGPLHHIGVITSDLDAAVQIYEHFGFTRSDLFRQEDQGIDIILMNKDQEPMIELIVPFRPDCQASSWLKRIKAGPYHVCFAVPDLDMAIGELREKGFVGLGNPFKAIAFHGAKVHFLFSTTIGLLELIELSCSEGGSN